LLLSKVSDHSTHDSYRLGTSTSGVLIDRTCDARKEQPQDEAESHRCTPHDGRFSTKISCAGRHRGCPDIVCRILLFDRRRSKLRVLVHT
jgi:hypothetical protein